MDNEDQQEMRDVTRNPESHSIRKKIKVVRVIKKKRANIKPLRRRRKTGSAFLPKFPARHHQQSDPVGETEHNAESENENNEFDDPSSSLLSKDCDLTSMSDVWMAVLNLTSASQGLHIPFLGASIGGVTAPQALLPSQIFHTFQENHASHVQAELDALLRSNKLRKIPCQGIQGGGMSSTSLSKFALVSTTDYVAGVWDAFRNHGSTQSDFATVIPWFLETLPRLVQTSLSEDALQSEWERNHPTLRVVVQSNRENNDRAGLQEHHGVNQGGNSKKEEVTLDKAISFLLRIQVLIRDPTSSLKYHQQSQYLLWLPQWGLVLKSWCEARQRLLAYVGRASSINKHKKGEVSERNVLSENRHACISTKWLMDELLQQGQLAIVERPFGRFVRRVDGSG